MDYPDSMRIKQIKDNTEKMADAFTRIADALEKLANKPEPRTSQIIDAYTRGLSDGAKEVEKLIKELMNNDSENQTDI
jgi:hypothetical protein